MKIYALKINNEWIYPEKFFTTIRQDGDYYLFVNEIIKPSVGVYHKLIKVFHKNKVEDVLASFIGDENNN